LMICRPGWNPGEYWRLSVVHAGSSCWPSSCLGHVPGVLPRLGLSWRVPGRDDRGVKHLGKKGKRKANPALQRATQKALRNTGIEPVEPPLLVFVSSAIRGMEAERARVRDAIKSLALTRPWVFEETPASSLDVDEAYLSKVRNCDIFVLILGTEDRKAIRREYQMAIDNGKPVLAFVQRTERPAEFDEFVHSLRVKYAQYANLGDLYVGVRAALADEVTRVYRNSVQRTTVPELVRSLAPTGSPRSLRDTLGYVILGLDQQSTTKGVWLMFGAESLEGKSPTPAYPCEEIAFDDLSEITDVFGSLNRIMAKADRTPADRENAFLQAWQDEVLLRIGRHAVHRRGSKPARQGEAQPEVRYIILGVHRDWAPLIRLLRPQEVVGDRQAFDRLADEVIFRDSTALQDMLTAYGDAKREAGQDSAEFMARWLAGFWKLRINRPKPEANPPDRPGDDPH
jgi:hypothetical protein